MEGACGQAEEDLAEHPCGNMRLLKVDSRDVHVRRTQQRLKHRIKMDKKKNRIRYLTNEHSYMVQFKCYITQSDGVCVGTIRHCDDVRFKVISVTRG